MFLVRRLPIPLPRNVTFGQRILNRKFTTNPPLSDSISEKKDLLIWQLKLASIVGCTVFATYSGYLLVYNKFCLMDALAMLRYHWNQIFYGKELTTKQVARLNSCYNVALGEELRAEMAKYFIWVDNSKASGMRRCDALFLLEDVGVDKESDVVKRFISLGAGDSQEERKLSGCTLQEFAELIEALVVEEAGRGNDGLEERVLGRIREINVGKTPPTPTPDPFRLGNPLILSKTRQLISHFHSAHPSDEDTKLIAELEFEINRNIQLRDKLCLIQKRRRLSDAERKRLNYIQEEILLLRDDLSRRKHQQHILLRIK